MVEEIRNFTLEKLEANFRACGFEAYRAKQVFEWVYKKCEDDVSRMTNLPKDLKDFLSSYYSLSLPVVEKTQTSSDLTQKFLLRLKDDSCIETVSIPAKSRLTACLSTQVGCRYCCSFCASGSLGFKRNLSVSEILGQFLLICRNSNERVSNAVFMGIGEPLDNYENLMAAVRILNDKRGVNLGARKMTISTCGLPKGIERLSKEGLEVELSVSLHSAIDEKRDILMPVNKRFPLDELFGSLKAYYKATKRKITFEYILLGGYNTSLQDAEALCRRLKGLTVCVNLIPYNSVSCRMAFNEPSKLEVLFFKSHLMKKGIETTLRSSRGSDISASCGQLLSQ